MLQLNLQTKIELELKSILQEAIQSREIDPQFLRMVVLSPDASFEKLVVHYSNNWDTYFYKTDHTIVGEINIAQWLDIADEALEIQNKMDSSYIARAKDIKKKYAFKPPAITFEHLEVLDEAYIAFLVCLREELLVQIETGISRVATSFSQEETKHIIGFFTHQLTFNSENELLLHAFNNPQGIGPFYKVELTLPKHVRSKHYLNFTETGIQLFCTQGSMLEKSNAVSEVYNFDADDFAFLYLKDSEIHFRLNDEFENWTLETNGYLIENIKKAEEDFLQAFRDFFGQFPEKVFASTNIPNPLTEKIAFDYWFDFVVKYNIAIRYVNFEIIFNYGEEAYNYYLKKIAKTDPQYESAQRFLASKLFYKHRFQDSLTIFENVKNLSGNHKMERLCALFCLHEKEKYEEYASTFDSESELILRDLLDTLWLLRKPMDSGKLKNIEEKVSPLVLTLKNDITLRLLSVVLTKVYSLQNDRENALLQLQSVPVHETYERVLLQQELQDIDYIMQAYENRAQKTADKIAFEKHINSHSLNTEEKKKTDRKKISYEHCYYVSDKIEAEDYKWVYPLDAATFIAVQKSNEYGLVLAKITTEKSVQILQSITLPDTRKTSSCIYLDGIVYMADTGQGIVTYTVTSLKIEQSELTYRNKKAKANYENLTIADGYLYASNNDYLEIFDLKAPDANVLSDSLYINSGYYLFVQGNLLVVGAGAGLVILADVSDKTNPICLSTLQEDSTPNNMYVAFIGDYMISRSLYNIKDPAAPLWISTVQEDLAPTYYFAPEPEVPIISTGEEFLFTTLLFENEQAIYTNWRESLNKDNWFYERALSNLATAYFEDSVITYSKYDIIIWEKGLSPATEKIDIHTEVERLVHNCFDFIVNEYPAFCIGKVVLQYRPLFQDIEISFHESSSLTVLNKIYEEKELPVISSCFLLETYYEEVFEKPYDPTKTEFIYDADTIVQQLQHRKFEQLSARHVLILAENKGTYLHNVEKPWKPFRSNASKKEEKDEEEKTLEQILLSKNEYRIQQLNDEISENSALLDELLEILNKRISIPIVSGTLTNRTISSEENAATIEEFHEFNDSGKYLDEEEEDYDDDEWYCSPQYIIDPFYLPKIEEEEDKETQTMSSEYFERSEETYEVKRKAFEFVCSIPDKSLLRTILFNGIQCGYLHYNVKEVPVFDSVNQKLFAYPDQRLLIYHFLNNDYKIWDNFGSDTDIEFFLMSNLDTFQDKELQLRIVYKYSQLHHPLLSEYILDTINNGINYYTYKGSYTGIDLSILPLDIIKPFESLLLEQLETFETATDIFVQLNAEEQSPYIYALLADLDHENIPAIVTKKLNKAVKEQEQYGQLMDDDEEYEEESVFLVKLYRKAKVKRLLSYYENNEGPLWPVKEPLESFDQSWINTIGMLFKEGTVIYGDTFKTNYIAKLITHLRFEQTHAIPLEQSYIQDRRLALELIQYTYKYILETPAMALIVEPLILALQEYKEVFSKLKDKSKYILLQAAWNNVKNQELDIADQKADALLVMDPTMGQVYFLKARLLWLREGIPAYLAQEEYFIDKTYHDPSALARIYNLSGCALDTEKRYEEALPYFKKAALTTPNEAMYIANIAELYYKLGKPKEALKHAKSARANGNEGEILNEIIENKGVLTNI